MINVLLDTNVILDFLLERESFVDDAVQRILIGMKVCPVTRQILEQILQLGFEDFENAIQMICALEQDLNMEYSTHSQMNCGLIW